MTFLLCLLPTVCLAIELEQTYPQLSGTEVINKDTSISGLISYLATWAIVIAALAAIVSLVAGGFQYLTSAGMPGAMKDAKERIDRALLGLAILAASYLVLVTVNPQLTVLKIEYVPVETGLFLFTEDGYNEFTQDDGFRKIDDLIKQKKIYALTHDVQDLTVSPELGELAVAEWGQGPRLSPPVTEGKAARVNFFNFPLYAIGFWGGLEQDAKVIMYSQENFQGSKYEYTFEGKLDEQGAPKRPHGERHGMKLTVFNLDFDSPAAPATAPDPDFFKTTREFKVDFVNLLATEYAQVSAAEKERIARNIALVRKLEDSSAGRFAQYIPVKSRYDPNAPTDLIYPPLSLQIRRTGPGVYLYADSSHHNEERKFTESQDDFGGQGVDFSKKAEKIKIVNTKTVLDENGLPIPNLEERYDYLAIVHEDPHYTGNLRLFFEQRLDETEQVPMMCPDGRPWMSEGALCGYDGFNPLEPDANLETYLSKLAYYPADDHLVLGNLGDVGDPADSSDDVPAAKTLTLIAQQDEYGEVEYVSSMSIFELNPDPKACKEVRICTEKGFETGHAGGEGYCISYSYQGDKTKLVPEIGVVKYPMPLYQPVNIPKKAEVVKSKDAQGNIAELEDKDFAQEIRSLYIQGDCLVALFENKVEEWQAHGGPGPHSQVFSGSKQDLSRYEIGSCGSALRRVAGRYLSKPCAQAIAVFPIVKVEGEGGSAPLPTSGSSPFCITGQKVTIGTCAGDCCSDANVNICGTTPTDCCKDKVLQYESAINNAASGRSICPGVDTMKLVKAIMSRESCGNISKVASDGKSAGLMQIKPETAEQFKDECGAVGEDISSANNWAWWKNEANAEKQICMAVEYLKTLVGACGCDVRHLAAGYNGGGAALGACTASTNCGTGVAGDSEPCLMCLGTSYTRRWECLWDNDQHTFCNIGFRPTRNYVPKVNYCYSQF